MKTLQRVLVQVFLLAAFAAEGWAQKASGSFEGWLNRSAQWGGNVQPAKASYTEGRAIPFRFVASLPAGTSQTVRIKYDFSNGGAGRFFDYIQSFNATESGVSLLTGLTVPSAQQTPATWPIPQDPSLNPPTSGFSQPSGVLTTYNVGALTFSTGYNLSSGVKDILVTFTVAGTTGSGNRTVVIGYGAHLASELNWGTGGGASQFPGASRKAYISLNRGSDLNVSVNPDSVVSSADLEVAQTGPSQACAGSQVTYQVSLRNLGPNSATTITLTDKIPSGATLVSSSATAGTVSVSDSVTLSLSSLAPGSTVGLTLVVRLGSSPVPAAVNTVSVAAQTIDPVSSNNTAALSTTTLDQNPPVFESCPANIAVGNDPGTCGAVVHYAATAADTCSAVSVTYSPEPGTLFPIGVTTVTATARDASGNTAQCTFTVTVSDVEAPRIAAPAAVIVAADAGQCSATQVALGSPVASDNCAGFLVSNNAPASFPVGTTTVVWTVQDAAGLTATATQTVTVEDREPPVVTVPEDYVLDLADGECALTVDYTAAPATAQDNCTGAVAVTYSPAAGSVLEPGYHDVTVTAVDGAGNVASNAFRVLVRDNPNVSWPAARPLQLVQGEPGWMQASYSQCLNFLDQSRWYKFSVKPGSRVIATLTGLPQNYDLVLFKDIAQEYEELLDDSGDLPLLSAQFAADAFSPTKFSADAFSPVVFSPAAFSPIAFSPTKFSPYVFSPVVFSPAVFSPTVFSPDIYASDAFSPVVFSPTVFSPVVFSPTVFSPVVFSPYKFSPVVFSPAAFSEAQLRSVIAVSGFDGTANEGLVVNTWNNTGEFYIRVRGRNGVFQPGAPFQLSVFVETGVCEDVVDAAPVGTSAGPAAQAGGYRTLIVTDSGRISGAGSTEALNSKLVELAARPEVQGRIIDLADYPTVVWFNAQADANFECPYAKNLAASAIRDVLGQWRALNPVENVVLVGGDSVIPFYRYPDQAMIGPEKNYVPPVKDMTASQASLRLNYVLGQDFYGATCQVELKLATLPLPEVPVGRLVESPAEIVGMIQAYLDVPGGVLPAPTTALVTGYDFLSDAALGVEAEFEAGMGLQVDTLIDASTVPPVNGWTADQLRGALFGGRHDLVYLAGHFSAFSALAADYVTVIQTTELEQASVDFKNSILISAGCHSGYNAVDADGIPYVTPEPDWAQAAARRQATLIAGTGYQYGDTDFVEYSERLYLRFARELRTGDGPVSIGQALVRAKRQYLATTPVMRGIHEKSFLEATLFGLPMMKVSMPAGRIPADVDSSVVSAVQPTTTNPGLTLGLDTADVAVIPTFTERSVDLDDIERGGIVRATYLEGSAGTLVNPAEPVLPLEVRNVTVGGTTLRGVGWRGGDYEDQVGVVPLTGAATTEIRGVHASFVSDVLFPVRFWSLNYFDSLCGSTTDATRLYVWPAQFISANPLEAEGTLRRHTRVDFRLYYSANHQAYDLEDGSGQVVPAISAPPAISGVFSSVEGNRVRIQSYVTGNPIAGIQEVWVTYTSLRGVPYGKWRSLNLVQNPSDSTLWEGELDLTGLGADPGDIRYVVQAVNGVGLVSMHTRKGALHIPEQNDGWETVDAVPTSVQLISPPTGARYGEGVVLQAVWSNGGGASVEGRSLLFAVGDQQVVARTDASGRATATVKVLSVPGIEEIKVTFPGGFGFAPSDASAPITISPAQTQLRLDPDGASIKSGGTNVVSAILTDGNGPLPERSVLFIATGDTTVIRSVITDFNGRARLGSLPTGVYSLAAYFGEVVTLPNGGPTLDLRDNRYVGSSVSAELSVDSDVPVLSSLTVDIPVLVVPNHKMQLITVQPKFLDASGTPVSRIVNVTSSEPENGQGDGDAYPDIEITGSLTVKLRAERAQNGTGRIYTIQVETVDAFGNGRVDAVTVTVPK